MEWFLAGLTVAALLSTIAGYVRERHIAPALEELERLREEVIELRGQLDESQRLTELAAQVFRGERELIVVPSGARSAVLFAADVPTGHPRRGLVSTTALAVVENGPLVLSHWRDQCDNALRALGATTPKARKGAARQATPVVAVPAAQQQGQPALNPTAPNGAQIETLKGGETKIKLPDGRIVLVDASGQTARVFANKK